MLAYAAQHVCLPFTRSNNLLRRSRIYSSSVPTPSVSDAKNLSYDENLVAYREEISSPEWGDGELVEASQGPSSWLNQLCTSFTSFFEGSDRNKCLVLLNVMTFIMATNWVVVKDAETMMDPFTFSAMRFSIAAVAFLPFLKRAGAMEKEVVIAGSELGFWCALGYLGQSMGLLTTDASRASFLSAFTVILVPILAGISGKGVSRTTWMAAVVALIGTAMLEQGGGAPPCVGDIYNLLSAVFFAVQIIRTEHYSKTMAGNTTGLLATALATTAGISGVLAVGFHPSECLNMVQNFQGSNLPWKEILYTGVLSTDLVLFIELVALNNVSSTDAAIIYTMEPVLGAMMAYILLGERWGPMGWVGASLILVSSLYTQLMGDNDKSLNTAEGR